MNGMPDRLRSSTDTQQEIHIALCIRKSGLVLLAACVLCLIMGQSAVAQVGLSLVHPNLARGVGNDKTLEKYQWDSVNLFNGNLNISIPLGAGYPITGEFGYQFTLNYNSNV